VAYAVAEKGKTKMDDGDVWREGGLEASASGGMKSRDLL